MADITGRRAYNTNSSLFIPNVLPSIMLIDSNINDAAFLAFFSKTPKMNTSLEEFKWEVDQFRSLSDTVDGAVTGTTATTIGVDNPKRFNAGEVWVNKRTGELMYIKSVNNSTSNIIVTRGISALNSSGGTAAAAITDADTLIRLAPAVGENSSRQTTKTTTPTQITNYCQQVRWDLSFSRRQVKREFLTGAEMPYQTKKALKEAQKSLNATFIDSEKARYTNDDGDDVTLTQGMRGVPSTHTYAVGGTLHESSLDDFLMKNGLRQGSRNKVLFCSVDVLQAFTEIAKDRLEYSFMNLDSQSGGIGLEVLQYMAPNGGKLFLTEDRHMSENHGGDAFGVDMSQIKRRVFSNNGIDDDLMIIPDTQDKDDMGKVSTLYGDMGLEYGAEQHHFSITGVTGGAKGQSTL